VTTKIVLGTATPGGGFPLYGGGVGWPDFAAVARASGRFIAPRPEESTRTPTCAPKRERGSAASCI